MSLKVTVPAITGSRPVTALSKVDLPAPFGPMTETTSPGPTLMLTPDTIAAPPYPASTPVRRRTAGCRSCSPGALSDEIGIQHLLIGTDVGHGSL